MNDERQELEEKRFVEDVGFFIEQYGLPRMAGRILGWLLICDPPHQSLAEMSEALMASKGSISTMTRLLVQLGIIERIGLPGLRHDCFRVKPGTWDEHIKQYISRVTAARQLSERGLELLKGRDPQLRQRLEVMRHIHTFLEEQMRTLLERWEQGRKETEQ